MAIPTPPVRKRSVGEHHPAGKAFWREAHSARRDRDRARRRNPCRLLVRMDARGTRGEVQPAVGRLLIGGSVVRGRGSHVDGPHYVRASRGAMRWRLGLASADPGGCVSITGNKAVLAMGIRTNAHLTQSARQIFPFSRG